MALVDVLIPTCNRKTGLAMVLASLLGQTFTDIGVLHGLGMRMHNAFARLGSPRRRRENELSCRSKQWWASLVEQRWARDACSGPERRSFPRPSTSASCTHRAPAIRRCCARGSRTP